MKKVSLLILAVSIFVSCKKDYPLPNINLGYNYYPLQTGNWIIYDVDSIVHNTVTGNIDTFFYQIKEILYSSYTDLEGNTAYRIERYKRNDTTINIWYIKDVWSIYQTTTQTLKTEENIKYIKLLHPIKENKKWNGHAYNDLTSAEYKFTDVDITDTINSIIIDSVAHVLQLEEDNFIEYKFKQEKYAKNIGMVQFTDINLDLQTNGGYEYTERLNSYGNQ